MDRICINCKHLLKSWHTEPCKSCSGSGVSKKRPWFEARDKDTDGGKKK